jgi:hypothetical protein
MNLAPGRISINPCEKPQFNPRFLQVRTTETSVAIFGKLGKFLADLLATLTETFSDNKGRRKFVLCPLLRVRSPTPRSGGVSTLNN